MVQQTHTFDGLGELREILPNLAHASSHPVHVELGNEYEFDDENGAPMMTKDQSSSLQQIRHQAIWNNRDDRLAYIGTDKYEITQHEDLIGYIDDAIGQTVGEVDIGRIRDYGERIDGMMTLDGHNVDVAELVDDGYVPPESELMSDRSEEFKGFGAHDGTVRDILGLGIRFSNSFDASERIRMETMGYRYICQNWLIWGKETIGTFEQLHIDDLEQEDIEELIFDVIDTNDEAESMIVDSVKDDDYPLTWAMPALKDVGFGPRYQKRILERLRRYGTVDDEFSRWELYNAVTHYLDHETVENVKANVYDRHQNKASQVLTEQLESPSEDDIEAAEEHLEEIEA